MIFAERKLKNSVQIKLFFFGGGGFFYYKNELLKICSHPQKKNFFQENIESENSFQSDFN